jgi:hypothetical protein
MPVTATVSAGWTFTTGDTATASALNSLGLPTVTVPDGKDFVFGAGTVGAPSISFTGDSNTGLAQLAGTDTVSVVCGGVEAFRFINDQALAMPGANATPAYSFAGDANTGINSDTADELDIVCGGNVIATASATGVSVAGTLSATNLLLAGVQPLTAGITAGVARFWTDFHGRIEASGFTSTVVSGGTVTNSTDAFGELVLSTTVSGDRAVVSFPMAFTISETSFTNTFRAGVGTLSDATARFFVMIGLFNNTADTITATTGGGAWFQYSDTASAQWQCVTRSGATKETTTTAVTVTASVPVKLTILSTLSIGEGTKFYINDVLVATHATTDGLSSASLWGAITERTVSGTGARTIVLDSFETVVTGTR